MPRSSVTTPPPGTPPPEPHPQAPPPGTKLASHYSRCFGCGSDHPTGLRLTATVVDGLSLVAEFTVAEEHQGAPGLAHGGVLATALDETIGMTVWLLRRPYVTGRLEVDYVRPVPVGTTLYLGARVTGLHGRKAYLEGEGRMEGPDGDVAVRGAALFVAVPFEHFARYGRQVGEAGGIAAPDYEVNP